MTKTLIFNSTNVVVGTNYSRYRYYFIGGGFQIESGDKIALLSVSVPYSFFNITTTYNNNSYQYIFNGTTYTIVMPNGFYQLTDINTYFQYFCIQNGLYLVDSSGDYVYFAQFQNNVSAYANEIDLFPIPNSLPSGWTNPNAITLSGYVPQIVIFPQSQNSFLNIIGFAAGTYPVSATLTSNQSFLSTTVPNATPINSLILNCSLVNNNVSVSPYAFATFNPNVEFGSNITYYPSFPSWIDCTTGKYASIDIFFTDQNYNPVVFNDYNMTVELIIKSKNEII